MRLCTLLRSHHGLGLFDSGTDNVVELLPYFNRPNVTQTFVERLRHATILAAKLAKQHLSVNKLYHVIASAVEDQDTFTAYRVAKLFELSGALVMETCSVKLTKEACPGEDTRRGALVDLSGGEAIAICWERLYGVLSLVRSRKPFGGIAVSLDVSDLHINRLGNHEVDPVAHILQKRFCAGDARGRGDEIEAADALRDEHALWLSKLSVVAAYVQFWAHETYELLCDHATHRDTDDVDAAVFGPADVVQELD